MKSSHLIKFFDKIFDLLSSLKLAVLVIFVLAGSLGVATFIESLYDTATAQFWIYRSQWFHFILALLAVNIFCVAVSRLPWKKKHIPFLLAHLGILILLMGSWITERVGLDGNMRVSEGESTSIVELDTASLILSEESRVQSVPIPWIPPGVKFSPISVKPMGLADLLQVDQFISHADSQVSFVPQRQPGKSVEGAPQLLKKQPAIRLKVVGGPMKISQEIWLWDGAPQWKEIQAGPALFAWGDPSEIKKKAPSNQPYLVITPDSLGGLSYLAHSSSNQIVRGKIPLKQIPGFVIQPGWRGNVEISLLEWIPDATLLATYQPARVQYGSQAPTSAIHLKLDQKVDVWLGLGDRAVLHLDQREVEIGYFPKRVALPFSLKLDRFTVEHDQGTLNPAAYSSKVSVSGKYGQKEVTIGMNEPLEQGGFTVYQASYEEGEPRPVTSIFAVNRDPGRIWKYLGSALIVLGSVLLFLSKYRRGSRG